jgi:hypothetical protein
MQSAGAAAIGLLISAATIRDGEIVKLLLVVGVRLTVLNSADVLSNR